jgi:hypothetical protein
LSLAPAPKSSRQIGKNEDQQDSSEHRTSAGDEKNTGDEKSSGGSAGCNSANAAREYSESKCNQESRNNVVPQLGSAHHGSQDS